MTVIVGIDPGLEGAIALLCPEEGWLDIYDMPVSEKFTTRNVRTTDPWGVHNVLFDAHAVNAYVEDIYSSPQMGVVSAFNFGYSKGVLLGVLSGNLIPYTLVKPQQWQKAMRCPADPKGSVARASQLFPKVAHLFRGPRGGLYDGRAEAATIALYGALELGHVPGKVFEVYGGPGRARALGG